jgi:hypothetical protein
MAVGMMDETDGSRADETVHFGLDGAEFELNLSKADAEELRQVLEPYIKAGRKAGSRGMAALPLRKIKYGEPGRGRATRPEGIG